MSSSTEINSFAELRRWLRYEKPLYPNHLYDYLTRYQRVYNWRFIRALRWTEFFRYKAKRNCLYYLLYLISTRIKNRIGVKIGVEIEASTFGPGLIIHHNGSIVVSNHARVGDNCQLHGDNCIGNLGGPVDSGSPTVGDNVDIGVGAKLLGPITIADGIRIGANAVVLSSFTEPGITIAGIPARQVGKKQ